MPRTAGPDGGVHRRAAAVRAIDVIAAGGKPSVSFALDVPEYVQQFDTVAAARASYVAKLALARQSGDPERIAAAANNLGTVDHEQGDYDRALAEFGEAIRLGPGDAIPYYNRGNTYWNKGDHARAMADYDRAIQLDPKYAYAYNNRGVAFDDSGDHDRAIVDYDESIRLDPCERDRRLRPRQQLSDQTRLRARDRRLHRGDSARPVLLGGVLQPRPRVQRQRR